MQVIRYHRFSSKKQDKGSSLERQANATAALCERLGWTDTEVVEDKGQSAWKGDHLSTGNLGKLRKRIDLGMVEAGSKIVVENLDRLSRQDYRTARRWIEDVTDRDITIVVCRPELHLDRAAMSGANIVSILQHLLEANRASAESDRKSEFQTRNIERMTQQAREGIINSPRAPAWLKGETGAKGFDVVEERAKVVVMIYQLSASGMGYDAICKHLNATVPPWTKPWREGKAPQWRIGYVRDILNSPAVEGEYHVKRGKDRKPTGEIIRGYYPRVVEAELVTAARAQIESRKGTGGSGAHEAKNILSGLVTCKHCGGSVGRSLTGNGRGARYAYLTCRNSRYGTCENSTGIRYDFVERELLDRLLHLAMDDSDFAVVDDIAPLMARAARAAKAVEVVEQDQAGIMALLRKRPDSEALIGELDRIEAELKSANATLKTANDELEVARGRVSPAEHARRVSDVRELMDSDDRATREQARRKIAIALRDLIDSVEFDGDRLFVNAALGHLVGSIRADGTSSIFDLMKDGRASDIDLPEYRRRRALARLNQT